MTDIQNEKAFQKQQGVFLASKKLQAKKTGSGVRFYKKIGLGKWHDTACTQQRVCAAIAGASDALSLHDLTCGSFAQASRPHRKQLKETTLTTNAHSPAMSASEEESSSKSSQRWAPLVMARGCSFVAFSLFVYLLIIIVRRFD